MNFSQIKKLISNLPEGQRQNIREAIILRRGACLLLNKPYKDYLVKSVLSLLDGKEVDTPQSFRSRRYLSRNGKVIVTKVSKEEMDRLWEAINA